MSRRTVRRVLVMLDYGDGDPDNGEVFDLTALAVEMLTQSQYSTGLSLSLYARRSYADEANGPNKPKHLIELSWGGNAGEWVHGATHLEDVINTALADGDRVASIRKKASRLEKKAEALKHDAMVAKLEQVAAVRHQFPIARVIETPLLEAANL